MSRPKKDIVRISEQGVITEEGMLAYLRNELDAREKLEVEKLLSQDPFAQDALEGLQQAKGEAGVGNSISSLKRRVRERTGLKEKRVIKIHWVNYAWAAVVVGLLIGVGFIMINYFGKNANENMALNKAKEEPKQTTTEQKPPVAAEEKKVTADSSAAAMSPVADTVGVTATGGAGAATGNTVIAGNASAHTGPSGSTALPALAAAVAVRQGITTKTFANGQPLNYEAVITDKAGQPLKNGTPVSLRFTVHDASPTGKSLYTETDITSTKQQGLVDVMVGSSKNFGTVDFTTGSKYLQVEVDPNNTGKFNTLATNQVMGAKPNPASAGLAAKPTQAGASGPAGNGTVAMNMGNAQKQAQSQAAPSSLRAADNITGYSSNELSTEKDKKAEKAENENGSLDVAMKNFNSGDYKKSSKEFEKILKHDPDNIDAVYFGAISDYLTGNTSRSESGFNKILKTGTKFVEGAKWYKANILLTKGDMALAKSLLQEIAASNGSYKERAVKKMAEMGF